VGSFLRCLVALLAFSSGNALADDEQVWAVLRKGGKVVLLCHTHVVIKEGTGQLAAADCAAEVNLSPHGVEQARRLGEAFRAHDIVVGEVLSSPYCRCMDTGRLAFGHATAVQYLMPPGVVSDGQAALNNERVFAGNPNHHGRSNLVMIAHDLNIANVVLEPAEMGEMFVLQPNGADFSVKGVIHLNAP
jgi:phosphohistidine phosphatase SixA